MKRAKLILAWLILWLVGVGLVVGAVSPLLLLAGWRMATCWVLGSLAVGFAVRWAIGVRWDAEFGKGEKGE